VREEQQPAASVTLSGRVAWGLADQLLSSATNFGLVILAARLLGPARLGVVSVVFAASVLILAVHRALVSEPLVVAAASLDAARWQLMSRRSVSATLFFGVPVAACMAAFDPLVGGTFGRGLGLFAPWIVPALLQDLWRFILFRDGRGAAATSNDAAWALGMALAIPVAWSLRTSWGVVAAWGAGASAGALLGFIQTKARPQGAGTSWKWWRAEAWPLGRWLGMDRVVASAGAQGTILIIAGLLNASDVGGFRAVLSVFAPVSLLGPAIGIPGLPAMSAALDRSRAHAERLAVRLSGFLILMTGAYLVLVGSLKGTLLSVLYGPSFRAFEGLIYPIATAQLLIGASMGFILLMKAARQGPSLTLADTVGAAALFLAVWLLSRSNGLTGAAWGQAIGAGVTTALIIASCILVKRGSFGGEVIPRRPAFRD
jgi:O-antigen/teichoic acid export membrane protein